jgi:cytochrome oxidase assembly protein ShyY1
MTTRFWLRPKWIFGHLLCLFLIVLFVSLGFWQLRRLHGREAHNRQVRSRITAPITTPDAALGSGAGDAAYRRVRVTGTWASGTTTLVRSRSLDSQSGDDVLTTLDVDGKGLVVLRGFAPVGGGGLATMLSAVRPSAGQVTVTGVLLPAEQRGAFGPRDPATGHLDVVNRVDIPRLQRQQSLPLAPVYLLLTSSRPAEKDFIRAVPLPPLNNGPHLSYAIQWFIFATIGAIGWPLLLRRTARSEREEQAAEQASSEPAVAP